MKSNKSVDYEYKTIRVNKNQEREYIDAYQRKGWAVVERKSKKFKIYWSLLNLSLAQISSFSESYFTEMINNN